MDQWSRIVLLSATALAASFAASAAHASSGIVTAGVGFGYTVIPAEVITWDYLPSVGDPSQAYGDWASYSGGSSRTGGSESFGTFQSSALSQVFSSTDPECYGGGVCNDPYGPINATATTSDNHGGTVSISFLGDNKPILGEVAAAYVGGKIRLVGPANDAFIPVYVLGNYVSSIDSINPSAKANVFGNIFYSTPYGLAGSQEYGGITFSQGYNGGYRDAYSKNSYTAYQYDPFSGTYNLQTRAGPDIASLSNGDFITQILLRPNRDYSFGIRVGAGVGSEGFDYVPCDHPDDDDYCANWNYTPTYSWYGSKNVSFSATLDPVLTVDSQFAGQYQLQTSYVGLGGVTSLIGSGGVPEPADWALIIGGLCAVGGMKRRLRHQRHLPSEEEIMRALHN